MARIVGIVISDPTFGSFRCIKETSERTDGGVIVHTVWERFDPETDDTELECWAEGDTELGLETKNDHTLRQGRIKPVRAAEPASPQ